MEREESKGSWDLGSLQQEDKKESAKETEWAGEHTVIWKTSRFIFCTFRKKS